ncbi:MAG: type II toxin-antitoxin system RelE/ParE family toxin [Syntrophomonadaceae bacterium]|nr:type II toxin-antitoxin system RelE/ParE family toxin [Syntrophomonadaceae bacterium]
MYKVVVTELVQGDLDSIVSYIAGQLANPTAVGHLLDEVDECYSNLRKLPLLYELSRDNRLATEEYHKAVIGNYVMIYKVNEATKTVTIYRFFYGPRDYTRLI